MVDNEIINDTTTPVENPPTGLPKIPVVPFSAWSWVSPVIPQFYWNVYSAEQRIKEICLAIGRVEAYLDYFANKTNENNVKLADAINQVYKELTERLDTLEQRLTDEVNRLDALIVDLGNKLEQEVEDRKNADSELNQKISDETENRIHEDDALHTEISEEVQNRIHADDVLHTEISNETAAREHDVNDLNSRLSTEVSDRTLADKNLQDQINQQTVNIDNLNSELTNETSERMEDIANLQSQIEARLKQSDIKAGEHITVTPGADNEVTIGTDLDVDLASLHNADAALGARIDAEIDERRNDDNELWTAVNRRIEMGKILAGDNIIVVNDPDESTVTISATGGAGGGITEVNAGDGIEVSTEDSVVTVSGKPVDPDNPEEYGMVKYSELGDTVNVITPKVVTTAPTGPGIAIGNNAQATNSDAITIGAQAYSNHSGNIAIGSRVRAYGSNNVAIGASTTNDNVSDSIIIGRMSSISEGVVIGRGNSLSFDSRGEGAYGVAIGYNATIGNAANNVAIGANSSAENADDKAAVFAVGSDSVPRRVKHLVDAVDPTDAVTLQQAQALVADVSGIDEVEGETGIVVTTEDSKVTVSGKPVDPENPNEYGVVRYSDLGDTNVIAPNRSGTLNPATADNNGLAIGIDAQSHGGLIIGNEATEGTGTSNNVIIGLSTSTSGNNNTVVGHGASSSSNYSVAVGHDSIINQDSNGSTVVNGDVGASSSGAVAVGASVPDNSSSTIVIGDGAYVSTGNPNATVVGGKAYAHQNCVAIGYNSDARIDPSTEEGGQPTFAVGSDTMPRRIKHVAPGADLTDAVTLGQVQTMYNSLLTRIEALEG